jgi:hypothetical protein
VNVTNPLTDASRFAALKLRPLGLSRALTRFVLAENQHKALDNVLVP